jgi:diguanylate cyclase (GGDEF)-like protein
MIAEASIARAEATGLLPPDRLAARLLAHALIERTQVVPQPELVDALAEQARTRRWPEVHLLLRHCQLIGRSLSDAAWDALRESSDAMVQAAEDTRDEILIALALASRVLFVAETDHPESLGEEADGLLARAVAMLDDVTAEPVASLGLRAVELPAAYVECGQAYHRLGLWELEEEMYVRAAAALHIPLPPATWPVRTYTRRVLVFNRLEGTVALTCALLEVGDRETARKVAAGAVRPTVAERADLPPIWASESRALEYFLDVVAGDAAANPSDLPTELYTQLDASTWTGYRACLLLGTAIGAHDDGDDITAAALAERALLLLGDRKPSITTLALHLAAQSTRDVAALRYSRHLASLRWQARLVVLGAARSRLAAARVLRKNEQLSRKAYVDALTGLGNRHAEIRHLARLRRRAPRERICVVLVDVDHFKTVNDTFGHVVGDDVLRVIGSMLQSAVRPADLAVRIGGDEFMLLIDLPPGDDTPQIASGLVRGVATHRWADVAPALQVSISAGQAIGSAAEVDHLVRAADESLYRAKSAGRGRAVAAIV